MSPSAYEVAHRSQSSHHTSLHSLLSQTLETSNASAFKPNHDADLQVPSTRVDSPSLPPFPKLITPIQELIIPHAKRASNRVPADAGVQTRKEAVNVGTQAAHGEKERQSKESELKVLRDLVNRQNAILTWYQTHHPSPEPSSIKSILKSYQETDATPSAFPILRCYDDRLALAERKEREALSQVARLEGQNEELKRERNESQRNVEMIREQIQAQEHKECLDCQNWQLKYEGLERQMETLKTERDQLQKQIQQDEATLERALNLQQSLKSLTPHLTHLTDLTQTQSLTITTLESHNDSIEHKLLETSARLDQSIKTNKQLVERGSILEKKVRDLEKRGAEWKIEKDKDARWRRGLEGVVKDWKVCLKELNLTAAVGDDPSPEFLVGLETILSTQILKLKREMEDLKRALHDSRKVHTTLEREHTACLQRYILEMEKKEAQSTVAKEHLAELIETAERSRRDREKALEEVRHITRDKTMVEDGLRRVLRQKEEEIVDLTMKSNEQIKSLREQYDNDRMRLQQKVDELSNSKVELQVEIGRLMRDKRAAEFELDSVTKGIEAKRRDFVLDLSLGAGKSDGGISVYGR